MSTTSSSDTAGGSQSQVHVHTCTIAQSQEEPVPATSSDTSRIALSMSHLMSQLKANAWVKTLCKAVSSLKNIKAGFWSHVMIATPLLVAILTLWPTFAGSAEAEKATELAKWTARKDFIEFCQSVSPYNSRDSMQSTDLELESSTGSPLGVMCSPTLWGHLRFFVDNCHPGRPLLI